MAHLAETAENSREARTSRFPIIGLKSLLAVVLGRLGCQTVQL